MAIDSSVSFLIGLVVVLMTDEFQNNNALPIHVAAARISLQPLWDTSRNSTSLCTIEERNASNGELFLMRGSEHHICRVRVITSPGSQTAIDVPEVKDAEEVPYFFYIEREGNLTDCLNKFVVLKGQSDSCTSLFSDKRLRLNLQGNVSISVSGILTLKTQHVCQDDDKMLSPSYCYNVKGFSNRITCDLATDEMCKPKFPSNCNVTLGYREVVLDCMTNGVYTKHESLLIYPIDVSILDLGHSHIVKMGVNSLQGLNSLTMLLLAGNQLEHMEVGLFQGLSKLTRLELQDNQLSLLPEGLFEGLKHLQTLYLYGNHLTDIPANLFQDLDRLYILALHENHLTTLPGGIWSGMRNLNALYLHENQLRILDDGAFRGLNRLTSLFLNNNMLESLPMGLFNGLGNLLVLHIYNNHIVHINSSIFSGLSRLNYLTLNDNHLVILPSRLLVGMENLYALYLYGNSIELVNVDMFHGLSRLTYLYLYDNSLQKVPVGLFRGLINLSVLYLNGNQLTSLESLMFKDLGRLIDLALFSNNLSSLSLGLFSGMGYLKNLYLHDNELVTLETGLFQGLTSLSVLSINDNRLTTLPVGLFSGLANLNRLDLTGNVLGTFNETVFHGLNGLVFLVIDDNMLTELPGNLLLGLHNLNDLYLYDNQLITLHQTLFTSLSSLTVLDIHSNKMVSIPGKVFHGLNNLEFLSLSSNKLTILGANIFKGLANLRYLLMHDNQIAKLDYDIFNDTVNLKYLELSENKFRKCPNIKRLILLTFLSIRDNNISEMTLNTLSNLPNNSELVVSQHEICECFITDGVSCSAANDRSPYLTCDRLLSDRLLVVMMWLIGINALGGNLFVLVWRRRNTNKYKVQDLLLSSLAMADSLMGIYMLIIACADIYFGEQFPMQSESWRAGIICRIAGALSIASSEASVFFVTLISIDRYISISFPYSTKKLGRQSTIVTSALIWIFSLGLGVVPSILAGKNFKFYDNSHVCIGLPLALTKTYSTQKYTTSINPENTILLLTKHRFTTQFEGLVTGLYFSTALFLGLNCLCYLIILGCYIEIVRAVVKSSKQSGRTRDMKEQISLTIKVAAIVATDFMCWFPIIVLGILVQTQVVTLPPSVYAWSVTFVLPLNSAINPYLYTIAEIISKHRREQAEKTISQSISMKTV